MLNGWFSSVLSSEPLKKSSGAQVTVEESSVSPPFLISFSVRVVLAVTLARIHRHTDAKKNLEYVSEE